MRSLIWLLACSALGAPKIAYIQDGQLWVKMTPAQEARPIVSSGSPHQPLFSADGEWVAFLDGDQLGVVASEGGEIYRPLGAQPVERFRWSPTASLLAAITEDAVYMASGFGWGAYEILVRDTESVSFSSDGKLIAVSFLERDQNGIPSYGRLDIFPVGPAAMGKMIAMASQWEQILPFTWSGDTIVAWKGEISGSAESDGFEIWGYPVSGGAPRRLGGPALVNRDLHDLSQDGKKLALTNGEGRQAWTNKGIAVIDLGNGELTALTSKDTAALYPAWSPNGKQIAFVEAPDAGEDVWGGDEAKAALNARHLWIMNPDGAQKRQLTFDPNYRDERPVWSADGKSLFFVRLDGNDKASLWTIGISGGEPRLVAGPIDLNDEAWFGYYGHIDWSDRLAISR